MALQKKKDQSLKVNPSMHQQQHKGQLKGQQQHLQSQPQPQFYSQPQSQFPQPDSNFGIDDHFSRNQPQPNPWNRSSVYNSSQ